MIFQINQTVNISVNLEDENYLFVERKHGFKLISSFFQNKSLIFESSLITYFLLQNVDVRYQQLPDQILLERTKGWLYSLYYENSVLSMKIKYFRRPAFRLYLDGKEAGSIGNPKLFSVESRNYMMKTEIDSEKENLYFLILFISQLRAF